MKKSIEKYLLNAFPRGADFGDVAQALADYIHTPEFAALYAQRCPSLPIPGLVDSILKLEKTMSALTDACTAIGKQIASLNPAQNAAHLQAIDDHLTSLDTKEGADEAAIADTTAGLQALLDAAQGGATAGAPAPAPAPAPAS